MSSAVREASQAVDGVKGAAAEGRRGESLSWEYGKYPCYCR